jgi:hypothetical protein
MKAVFSLLALAAVAVAQDLVPKWNTGETTTTLTTFTTFTTCPVTSTTVEVSFFRCVDIWSKPREA